MRTPILRILLWLATASLLSACTDSSDEISDAGADEWIHPKKDGQGPPPDGNGPVPSGGDAGGTATGDYPPIYITLNIHGHNYGYPAQMARKPTWMEQKQKRYTSDKDQILWVTGLAESVGARVNIQLNGEFCRDARLLDSEGTAYLVDLAKNDHVLGSHFHMYRYSGSNEYWENIPNNTATEADLRVIWTDHITECEQATGEKLFRIDPAIGSPKLDVAALLDELKAEYALEVEPAGEAFSYTHWNHRPWHPFRRKTGTKLEEDSTRSITAAYSIGQIGQLQPAGKHQTMASVPQLQRQFLNMVAEWREHERSGAAPKIWQFGVMTHPNETIEYHDDVETIILWLAEWTNRKTASGASIAAFATDLEVKSAFESWEAAHPGQSSFSFDLDAYLAGDDVAYPWTAEGVTLGIKDCELDEELDAWADDGVVVFRLLNREVKRGEPDAEGIRELTISETTRLPVYLLWSETGAAVTIDFTSEKAGSLHVKRGDGTVEEMSAKSLKVTPAAMVVSETTDYWD